MKTIMNHSTLIAWILLSATLSGGCSSFQSPSSEYVKPGQLSVDVSKLPDPNEDVKKNDDSTTIRNIVNQMGGGVREESPERLLMQANSYFEQKRYHDSARLYKKYLNTPAGAETQPELLGTIHYRIGYVANKKTFYKEAQAEYALALQYAPLNNEYLFAYAKACYDAGDFAIADQQFVALLSRAPGYPEAEHYYGLTLLESVNRANALQPLTNALGALQANELLADKYYAVGDLASAAIYENQMIQLAAQQGQPIPTLRHKQKLLESAQQNEVYAHNVAPELNANQRIANAAPNATAVALDANRPQISAPLLAMTPTKPTPSQSTPIATVQIASPSTTVDARATVASKGNELQSPTQSVAITHDASSNASAPQNAANIAPSITTFAKVQPVFQGYAPAATTNANQSTPAVESHTPTNIAPQSTPTASPVNNMTFAATAPVSMPQLGQTGAPNNVVDVARDNDDEWDESAFATSGSAQSAATTATVPTNASPQTNLAPSTLNRQVQPVPPNSIPNYAPHIEQGIDRQGAPGFTDYFGAMKDATNRDVFASLELFDEFERALTCYEYGGKGSIDEDRRVGYLPKDSTRALAQRRSTSVRPNEQLTVLKEDSDVLLQNEGELLNSEEYYDHFSLCAQGEIFDHDGTLSLALAELPSKREFPIRSTAHIVSAEQLVNVIQELPTTNEPVIHKQRVLPNVNLGPSNPGLYAVSMRTPTRERDFQVFRPGSIAEGNDSEQNLPDEVAAKLASHRQQEPKFVAKGLVIPRPLSSSPKLNLNDALQLFDTLVEQESLEFSYRTNRRPELLNLRNLDQEEAWDEAAFASSGNQQSNPSNVGLEQQDVNESSAAGFGDYQAPVARVALLPDAVNVNQSSGAKPPVAQQSIVTNAVPSSNLGVARPQGRSQMTPNEKLQAARNAGAEVVELTPEQYRSAVVRGIGAMPQK